MERIFHDKLLSWMQEHSSAGLSGRDWLRYCLGRVANALDSAYAKKGGIDLTPANMHLETQNGGQTIKFHLDPAQLAQLQNAPGFVPVIINIQPLKDLKQFLGINSVMSS